ncbi:GNAT family N-acetyltransferase [Clostridium butyricum]|uniref:GNAT family N-acetyltransferase n=1 Tax=Clostridium butyricum TaxID=1492 RepID=UPI002AAFC53E|nr:GNAT family N-acetyltransferase [Clostridium butyricum]
MNLRLATIYDLPILKTLYEDIVENMKKNNIDIWDNIYPYIAFNDDIKTNSLYLLINEKYDIVGCFALCESSSGEKHVKWKNPKVKALYLERLGVNPKFSRQGIGSILLRHAAKIAKENEVNYLRLFVVDINKPAINLYVKNGFSKVHGVYAEKIDGFILREYGFEIKLDKGVYPNDYK